MATFDPAVTATLAEVLANLSSGWFGAVLIAPHATGTKRSEKILVLTGDIVLGILCLILAMLIRKL